MPQIESAKKAMTAKKANKVKNPHRVMGSKMVTSLAFLASLALLADRVGWGAPAKSPRDLLIQSVRAPEAQREGYIRQLADIPVQELAAHFSRLMEDAQVTEEEKIALLGHMALHPVPEIMGVFDHVLLTLPLTASDLYRTALQIRSEQTGGLSPGVALTVVRRALDQSDEVIRLTGLMLIGRLPPAEVPAILRRVWTDPSPLLRQMAYHQAVVFLSPEDVLPLLQRVFTHPDSEDRVQALMAALRLAHPAASSLAAHALMQEKSEALKLAFLEAFQADPISGEGPERLLEALIQDGSPAVREAAILASAHIKISIDWPLVLLASRQSSPAVRVLAAQWAPEGAPAQAHALALSLSHDPDPSVRAEAARTLFLLGQTDIDREVFRLSKDPAPQVRQLAWTHLAECHEHVIRQIIQNILLLPEGPLEELSAALQTSQRLTLLNAELTGLLTRPQHAARARALVPWARQFIPEEIFRWTMGEARAVLTPSARLTLLLDVLNLSDFSGPPSKAKDRALLWMEELLGQPGLAGRERLMPYLRPEIFSQRPTLRALCVSLAFSTEKRLRGQAWDRLYADRRHPRFAADLLQGLRTPRLRQDLLGSMPQWADALKDRPEEAPVIELLLDELLQAKNFSPYGLQQSLSRLNLTLVATMLHDRLSPTTEVAVLQRVLHVLELTQDARSIAIVKSWAEHASPLLRLAAVNRLGQERDWPRLLPLRQDPDRGVRQRVWEYLVNARLSDCLPWVMEVFRQPFDAKELPWRLELIQLLAGRRMQAADDPAAWLAAWEELLTQPHPTLQLTALRHLIQLRVSRTEDLLISLVTQPLTDPELRGEALIGLVQLQAHQTVPALITLRKQETGPMDLAILWAIARLSHPQSVDALLAALTQNPDDTLALMALRGLSWQRRQWSGAVEEAVWRLAESRQASLGVRVAAVETLGLEPEDTWLPRFIALLQEASPDLRDPLPELQDIAMRAVGRLAGPEAEEALAAHAQRVQGTPRELEVRQLLDARAAQKPKRFAPYDPFAHLTPLQRMQAEREGPGDVIDRRLPEWRKGKIIESPEFQGAAIRKPRPATARAWDALAQLTTAGQWDQAVGDALALWEEAESQEMSVTTLTHAIGLKTQLAEWFRRLPPAGRVEYDRLRASNKFQNTLGDDGDPSGHLRGTMAALDAGEWAWARTRLTRADPASLPTARAWLEGRTSASPPEKWTWGPPIPLPTSDARTGWTPAMEPRAGFPLAFVRKTDGPVIVEIQKMPGSSLRGLPSPSWYSSATIDGLQWVEGNGWIANGRLAVIDRRAPAEAVWVNEHHHTHRVSMDLEGRRVAVLENDVRPLALPQDRPRAMARRLKFLDPRSGDLLAERDLPPQFDVFSPLIRTPWGLTWVAAERQPEATRFWCFGLTDRLDWAFPPLLLGALHEPPTPILAWEVGCATDGQRVYTWMPNGWVVGVNPSNGSMSWATRVAQRTAFWVPEWTAVERQGLERIHQTVSSGRLVAAVNPTYDEVWGLDPEDGHPLWSAGVPERSRVLDIVDEIVIVESPRQLQGVDGRTGRPVWTRTFPSARAGFGASRRGTVFALYGRELITLNARTGDVLQRLPLPRGERGYHVSAEENGVWLIAPASVLPLTAKPRE